MTVKPAFDGIHGGSYNENTRLSNSGHIRFQGEMPLFRGRPGRFGTSCNRDMEGLPTNASSSYISQHICQQILRSSKNVQ